MSTLSSINLVILVTVLGVSVTAGAAPEAKKTGFQPVIEASTYGPTKERDPFSRAGAGAAAEGKGAAVLPTFHLDGILYDSNNPSASVNGQLLTLNKTVQFDPTGANIPVRAVVITRQRVVLEVAGKRVELSMEVEVPAEKR